MRQSKYISTDFKQWSILFSRLIRYITIIENFVFLAIIGGGIGGAASSHFLTELFNNNLNIDLYEAKIIGGRLATIKIDGNEFEAGGSIIHPQNKYMRDFVELLGTLFSYFYISTDIVS